MSEYSVIFHVIWSSSPSCSDQASVQRWLYSLSSNSVGIRGCVPNCMANWANGGYIEELKLKEFKSSKNWQKIGAINVRRGGKQSCFWCQYVLTAWISSAWSGSDATLHPLNCVMRRWARKWSLLDYLPLWCINVCHQKVTASVL